MPALPEAHAIAVIALTIVAFYLFTRDDVPLATTSLTVLVTLTVGFHLWPYHTVDGTLEPSVFFLGFGHEALVTICALMIIGRGLVVTGALEPVARIFSRALAASPRLAMLSTCPTPARRRWRLPCWQRWWPPPHSRRSRSPTAHCWAWAS
jgi:di/tricarboxylate transporter